MSASVLTRSPDAIAGLAVAALLAEADLTPKPGLVDRRGPGAHADMSPALLVASAEALRDAFAGCAQAAGELPVGLELRARVGAIGRAGERDMLAATGGVNTHRGALWALGLLSAGAACADDVAGIVAVAAELASLPDPGASVAEPARLPGVEAGRPFAVAEPARPLVPRADPGASNGARARRRFGVSGAAGEARAGFPHVTEVALPVLRDARLTGNESCARLDALLALMASLDDTCLLHRGGRAGLLAVQSGAAAVLAAGGTATDEGWRRLAALDALASERRLSPGGSGDLLAATLFLDALEAEVQTLNYEFPATEAVAGRVHVGVVASGDLEILLEPGEGAHVRVRTSVDGFDKVWQEVLERFFARTPLGGRWELNDFGATPGVVALRLQQAAEAARA